MKNLYASRQSIRKKLLADIQIESFLTPLCAFVLYEKDYTLRSDDGTSVLHTSYNRSGGCKSNNSPSIHKKTCQHSMAGSNSLSDRRGSNPRPAAWEAAALPTELLSHKGVWLADRMAHKAKHPYITHLFIFYCVG